MHYKLIAQKKKVADVYTLETLKMAEPNPRICAFECAKKEGCVGVVLRKGGGVSAECKLLREMPVETEFVDDSESDIYFRFIV